MSGFLYDDILNVQLRESPMYPGHYISRCGRFVRNTKYSNITKVYGKNPDFTYLQSDGIRIHRLVASAWVHNPHPAVFDTVDHRDADTQHNSASNLRWVTKRLNCIHRARRRYYERVRTRGGRVYYVSKIKSHGETTKLYSPTKEEAEIKTKGLIHGMFEKVYLESISDAPPGLPRRPDTFLWTDTRSTTPGRSSEGDTRSKRAHKVRNARWYCL